MRSVHGAVLCAAVALSVAAYGGTAISEEAPPQAAPSEAAPEPAASGSELYLRHCAICHGLDGRGHGPLADAMKIVPADLTRVTARNGGTFPDAKISDVIRNGGGVLGHGSNAMLPWGIYFSERRNPQLAKDRINALVAYLKSLQQD